MCRQHAFQEIWSVTIIWVKERHKCRFYFINSMIKCLNLSGIGSISDNTKASIPEISDRFSCGLEMMIF